MKVNGGPAFPNSKLAQDQTGGMTLRQWYAGHALQGVATMMLVTNGGISADATAVPDGIAKACFELADAMIKAGE